MPRRANYIPPLLAKRMVEQGFQTGGFPDVQSLAEATGIPKSRLADYIRGDHVIPLDRALEILEALRFKPSESKEALALLYEVAQQGR